MAEGESESSFYYKDKYNRLTSYKLKHFDNSTLYIGSPYLGSADSRCAEALGYPGPSTADGEAYKRRIAQYSGVRCGKPVYPYHYMCLCPSCAETLGVLPPFITQTYGNTLLPKGDEITKREIAKHDAKCPGCMWCIDENRIRQASNRLLFMVFWPKTEGIVSNVQPDASLEPGTPFPPPESLVRREESETPRDTMLHEFHNPDPAIPPVLNEPSKITSTDVRIDWKDKVKDSFIEAIVKHAIEAIIAGGLALLAILWKIFFAR